MDTIAVVLRQPEHLSSSRLALDAAAATRMSSSTSSGADQHRYRAAALVRAHAAISRAWAIRWCPATNPSVASSMPGRDRAASRRAVFVPGRALLRGRARPVRRRGLAPGGAGARVAADR